MIFALAFSAVAIVAFGLTFKHYLDEPVKAAQVDIAREIIALEDLARFMQTYDKNQDGEVVGPELGNLLTVRPEVDANGDGKVSIHDGRAILRRIRLKLGEDVKITPAQWGRVATSSTLFNQLDGNHDGVITARDFEAVMPETSSPRRAIRDERSGEMQNFGELRLTWMRHINNEVKRGELTWKNQLIKKEYFGNGLRAKVRDLASGRLSFGFLSEGRSPSEICLLDDKGAILFIPRERVEISTIAQDSASEWYHTTVSTEAADAEGWRSLALKLHGSMLEDEAIWAAKKALLYRPDFVDLYPIVGVDLVDDEIVNALPK